MRPAITATLLVLAALLLVWRPWYDGGSLPAAKRTDPRERLPEPPPPPPDPPPSPGASLTSLPAGPLLDMKRSPLADELNAEHGSINDDLAIVQELFAHYRSVFGANPAGSNREITGSLTGYNKRLFAPLPRDHDALNADGELTDRWGTPFFFHNLSAEFVEVRSAGPDRKHWTDDDVTASNAPPDSGR